MSIRSFGSARPTLEPGTYVDDDAILIGDVVLREGASVWPGAILRGDDDRVEVGRDSAIMDMAFAEGPKGRPVKVGVGCMISHGARLHGCVIQDGVLVGIGAIVLDGSIVGERAIIAAGAVVPPDTKIPPRALVAGVPAKAVRETTEADAMSLDRDLKGVKAKAEEYANRNI